MRRLRRRLHHGAGPNRLACFGARDQGRCDNHVTVRRDEVEARVLRALRDKLLRQDLFEEFCDEFTREMNRLRMEQRASLSAAEREIDRIEVRRKKLIEMVMNGVAPSEVKDEPNANAARREELKAKLAAADAPPPLPHPEIAGLYRQKVSALAQALEHPETRPEVSEALRGLIEAIVLMPNQVPGSSRAMRFARASHTKPSASKVKFPKLEALMGVLLSMRTCCRFGSSRLS
jgi:site-specific DNA recombinase